MKTNKPTKAELKKMAVSVRQVARDFVREGIAGFKKNLHMQAVYRADGADLQAIAALIEEGSIEAASNKAQRLDTLVRELIPAPVWDFLVP